MDHSRNGSSWVTSMPNKTQAVISIGGGKVIDAGKYADGRLADRLRKEEEKRPALKNLVNGEIDYSVHQRILDFGFIDSARLDKNFSEKNFGARIDFIYISPDLKSAFTGGNFIIDDFTKKYSDHRPVYMTWEK